MVVPQLLVTLIPFLIFAYPCSSSSASENFLLCINETLQKEVFYPNTTFYYSSIRNLRFSQSTNPKPLVIVAPLNELEVQQVVICAKKSSSFQIRVRSGGHDYEGLSSTSAGGVAPFVVLDLMNLRSVTVDTASQTAFVQAGATLGQLYYRIAEKSGNLGFPAGSCPTVGVGGHFSGGGLGALMRKYGLASDNIVDAKLVDVNGIILDRAAMGEDLFWAIRGGGGTSFGIILSWKIKLVVVPSKVTVFTISKTVEEGALNLAYKWQYIADKLHEDLFIRLFIQASPSSFVKGKNTIQVQFNSMFLGGVERLLPLMAQSFPELGLLQKDCTQMSWIESIPYFAGRQYYGQSLSRLLDRNYAGKSYFKGKTDFVKEPISEIGIQGMFQLLMEQEKGYMILDPLGGKVSNISESEIPFPHRLGNLYNIQYTVKWKEQDIQASTKYLEWMRKIYGYMTPYVSKSPRTAYVNYKDLDLGNTWGTKCFKGNFDRLTLVKRKVDPDNFFRNEQSIPPLPN